MALHVVQDFGFQPRVDPLVLKNTYGIPGTHLLGTNTVGSFVYPFVPSTNPNNPLEMTVSKSYIRDSLFKYFGIQLAIEARNTPDIYLPRDDFSNPAMWGLGFDLEWMLPRVRADAAIAPGTYGFENGQDLLSIWGAANAGYVRVGPGGFVYGQTKADYEASYLINPAAGGYHGDYVIDKTLDTYEQLAIVLRELLDEGFTIPNVPGKGNVVVPPRPDIKTLCYIFPGIKEYYQNIDPLVATAPGTGPWTASWGAARYAAYIAGFERIKKRYNPTTGTYEARDLSRMFDVWVADVYPFHKNDTKFADYISRNISPIHDIIRGTQYPQKKIYAYVQMVYHPSTTAGDHILTDADLSVYQTTLRSLCDSGKLDGYVMWGGYGSAFNENTPFRNILPLSSSTPPILQKSINDWRSITNGCFRISRIGIFTNIGGSSGKVSGMNFSSCTTMQEVAAVMQTKINEYLATVAPNAPGTTRTPSNGLPMYSASYPFLVGPIAVTYHTSGTSPSQSTPFFKFSVLRSNDVDGAIPPNHGYYSNYVLFASPSSISNGETDISSSAWVGSSNVYTLSDRYKFRNLDEFADGWGLGTNWWNMMVADANKYLLSQHQPSVDSITLSAGYVLRATVSSNWTKTPIANWEISITAPNSQNPEITTVSASDSTIRWTYSGTVATGTYYLRVRIQDTNGDWSDYSASVPAVVYIQPPPPEGGTGQTGGGQTGDDGEPIDPPPPDAPTFVIVNSPYQSPGYSNALPPEGRAANGLILGN